MFTEHDVLFFGACFALVWLGLAAQHPNCNNIVEQFESESKNMRLDLRSFFPPALVGLLIFIGYIYM